jgi:hypothetical protein
MAIEGMIEFCIRGYLNSLTAKFDMDGEIMGITLSGFCLFLSSTLLPLTLIYMLICKV